MVSDREVHRGLSGITEGDPAFRQAMRGLAPGLKDLECYGEAVAVVHLIAELNPPTSLSVLFEKKGQDPRSRTREAKARVFEWKQ